VAFFSENKEILIDFVSEVNEMLDEVESLLANGEKGDVDHLVAALFRTAHSIKGSSGFLGLANISRVAALLEQYTKKLRMTGVEPDKQSRRLLARCCAFFRAAMQQILINGEDGTLAGGAEQLLEHLETIAGTEPDPVLGGADQGLEVLVRESDELLDYAEQEFVLWQDVLGDEERLLGLYRILHRLRTNFQFYGYQDSARLLEVMEGLLDRALRGEVFRGEYPEGPFLQGLDRTRIALQSIAQGGDGRIQDLERIIVELKATMHEPLGELLVKAGLIGPQVVDQALETQRRAKKDTNGSRRLGEVLVEMGEVTPEQVSTALRRQKTGPEKRKTWDPGPVKEAGRLLHHSRVTVDGGRIEVLRQQYGELFQILHSYRDRLPKRVYELLQQVEENITGLDRLPLAVLLPRLSRMVRDLAARTGKQVRFRVMGSEIEIEQRVIRTVADALAHLVRNSIDHGIEPPRVRKEMDKSREGLLRLTVLKKPEEIWISVEDDGAGLDFDAIRQQGYRLGLLDEGDGKIGTRHLVQLIFKSGLTTASRVTESSGRGLGLAVVQEAVKKLGGHVDLFTKPGRGTRVTLRVPTKVKKGGEKALGRDN